MCATCGPLPRALADGAIVLSCGDQKSKLGRALEIYIPDGFLLPVTSCGTAMARVEGCTAASTRYGSTQTTTHGPVVHVLFHDRYSWSLAFSTSALGTVARRVSLSRFNTFIVLKCKQSSLFSIRSIHDRRPRVGTL